VTSEAPLALEVPAPEAGQRLDRFLAARLPQLSRARLQGLIRDGHLEEGGQPVSNSSRRVREGERYRLVIPPLRPAVPGPEALPLDILFEDEHLVVLVKPAGMVVHPSPGHAGGTLVNALLAHCQGSLSGIGGVERPGIVHRLDREVSGVLVAAKHDRAHIGLAGQFSVHSVERIYEGIVHGVPRFAGGTVDAPIGRHPQDRLRMAVLQRGGKRAVTRWQRVAVAGDRLARVAVTLETGRTHQIRVHMSHLGHPLVGDRLYGRRRSLPPGLPDVGERILLHARHLGFVHPMTGEHLAFTSAPPPLFDAVMMAAA
jgi:23S rRNA pseudouridine1911/1915/1917 synthase